VATGSPDTSSFGVLLRATYTIGQEKLYLRPSLDLSAVRVRSSGYQETGAGALNLAVDSASQTTWALTPALEVGGRVAVGRDMILRPYVSAGVSFLSNDEWKQTARLVGAPAGTDSFTTTVPLDTVVARVGAGVQLYTAKGFDLRLQYDGEFSSSVTANGGSLIASYRF
jgi:outer membrane autotransporter protein